MTDPRDEYVEAVKRATTDQGLDPIIERVTDHFVDTTLEQTGGFCMALRADVSNGTFVFTATEGGTGPYIAFYPGRAWENGEEPTAEFSNADETTLGIICTLIKVLQEA